MYLLLPLLFPFCLSAVPATLLPPGDPVGITDTVRGVPIRLVRIEGDTFQMGCFGRGDEAPMHPVLLQPFWLGESEVTVAQFEAFVKATGYQTTAEQANAGSHFYQPSTWVLRPGINWRHDATGYQRIANTFTHPVLHVSHDDALAYCAWLSKESGHSYRLPTEAEWEFAAGGGAAHTRYPGTDSESSLPAFGWFQGNSNEATHPVKQRQPNALGLYDMGGNAAEWCSDWYYGGYGPFLEKNPTGPDVGQKRVVRGGSWRSDHLFCTTTDRASFVPGFCCYEIGFRVVRE